MQISQQRWTRFRNAVACGDPANGDWVAEVHGQDPASAARRAKAIQALPALLAALSRIAETTEEPAVRQEAQEVLRLAGELP